MECPRLSRELIDFVGKSTKTNSGEKMMMSARPLNLAVRHVAPQTPLHRNDSAIESQSRDYQPATSNPSLHMVLVLGTLTMQSCTPCKHPGPPYICSLMRNSVKPVDSSFIRLSWSLPAGGLLHIFPLNQTDSYGTFQQ
jgi:hypothetical protein